MAQLDHVDLAAPSFGHALRGYERGGVDAYVAAADRRIAELTAEVGRLRAALTTAEDSIVPLDGAAAEIVRAAGDRTARVAELIAGDLEPHVVLDRARSECEVLLTAAQIEATRLVEDARAQAATVNERARQEYAWRRRQVRQEQHLVDQRKQQIVHEIKTLSALAAHAAVQPSDCAAPTGNENGIEQGIEERIAV